jgi:hypothetical protein
LDYFNLWGIVLMSKLLVVIDFENLFMGGMQHYNLALTQVGIKKLFEVISVHGEILPKNIVVAACWQDYRTYETYFGDSMNDVVRFAEKGKNVADGYLIVHGVLKYEQNKNDYETVILVAGDGVYSGLIRHALTDGKKVVVYSWEKSKNKIYKINDNMDIKILEDVFEISKGEEATRGYFISGDATEAEKGLMSFINNAREKSAFHTYFANTVIRRSAVSDQRYKGLDTFEKACEFIDDCESQGIITIKREQDTREGASGENKVMRLNHEHPKVKKFLNPKG